jgi:hypothetical protein
MTNRAMLAFLAFLSVAGCDQLNLGPSDPSPVAVEPVATEVVVEAPPPPTLPMPDFAAEVVQLVGQDFAAVFPLVTEDCVGHLDSVSERFGAGREGVRAGGWAFNLGQKSTFPLFVATDASGIIQGGGAGNLSRPDVIQARPDEITSEESGYEVLVGISSGPVTVYGIEADTNEACLVGTLPDVGL